MRKASRPQDIRYDRNIRIPEIGPSGQERLGRARVLVVGAGGLGSPVLFYLACAGVGTIGIADGDRVELSNLQRQIIHSTPNIGRLKVHSAMESIERINPHICMEGHTERLTHENGRALVQRYDFVIEATDNFETKFLVNDMCIRERVPFSHAGILGLYGQAMTVVPGGGACFRCIFGEVPKPDQVASTSDVGVLGAVAGVLGAILAAEAVKFIVGCGDLLTRRMLTFDALEMRFREVPLPEPSCGVCRAAGLIV